MRLLWEGVLLITGLACTVVAAYELWHHQEQSAHTWLLLAILFNTLHRKEPS